MNTPIHPSLSNTSSNSRDDGSRIPVTCDGNTSFHSSSNAKSQNTSHGQSGAGCAERKLAQPASAGLVYSQTSGTPSGQAPPNRAIRVDREAMRLKRLRCSVLTAARLHVQQMPNWKVAMVTLTYKPDVAWAAGQVSALVRHIRQYLLRRGMKMRHVWVQEFTKKGRPHYHMLLWLPLGLTLPKPDKRGWWPWGMTKIEWARNAIGYIAKYASKGDSLHQPAKGARMYGSGGLTGEALLEQRWWRLPGWLRHRDDIKPSDRVRRAQSGSGGGFLNPNTGEIYASPWVVFFEGGAVFIKRKEVFL
jgi:hypothetical protein